MRYKELIYAGLGTVVLVIIVLLLFQDYDDVSDRLTLAGIIINTILAVLVVTFLQNREGNSRSLKNYFITEISSLKSDYDNFINDVKSDKLNPNSIKKKFKDFSLRNQQLETFLKKELEINDSYIQKQNRKIHQLITNSDEFNSIYNGSNLCLSSKVNNDVIGLHKELNYHFISLIVRINKI